MSDHHHATGCQTGAAPDEARAPAMFANRRQALFATALGSLCAYALVREARAQDRVTDRRLTAKRWIDRQEELARGLQSGAVSAIAWHDEVDRMAGELDITQFLAEVRASRITPTSPPFMRDPVKRNIDFLDDQGRPRRLTYAAATFSFGPENVITPHAHKHMASAHMVIDGRVRIRTFDRLADRGDALLIRPSGDRVHGVGEAAAMTTAADNIHWFTPASQRAITFDVIVTDLDPGQASYVIQPVDPLAGQHQADGSILAPILSFETSMQHYSAHV